MLKKETGIYINSTMAEKLAENYAAMRTYNYIDATDYNIPWYLIYSFSGFPLHYMNIRRDSTLFKTVSDLGLKLRESNTEGYDYVYDTEGYVLRATDYRYKVDDDDKLNEWLDFSIIRPDDTVEETLLYVPVAEFSIKVDSYHFGNLINYEKWEPQQKLLDIAAKYMNP